MNAAAAAAQNEVFEYAVQFERREDYRPLEDLAQRIQVAAVPAGERGCAARRRS